MSETKTKNRRDFLRTGYWVAGAAMAVSSSGRATPRGVRSIKGTARSANDVIGIGIIGLGSISHGHIKDIKDLPSRSRIAAVCDIYKPRLEWGKKETGAKGYHDYHDLLNDASVDAVIICSPDHWHHQMTLDAFQAGKDVDVEKPMSLTIEEAREMVEQARAHGRVLAVDSEHTAHGIWGPAQHAVKSGVLGKLLWSQTSRSRNSGEPPWNYKIDADASPKNLDWERFIGPATKRPFDKERFFRWRKYWEYSGGIATDLYFHHITPLLKVTGPEFPIRVTAAGGNWQFPVEVIEVPDTFAMTMDFQTRHTMVVGGSLANSVELPIVVRGHEANILFHGPDQRRPSSLTIVPEQPYVDRCVEKIRSAGLEGKWLQEGKGANKSRSFEIVSPPSKSFFENFLDCIHSRQAPVLDGDLGFKAQVAVVLAVESYRQNKVMFFDPATQKVSDVPVKPAV